MKRLLLGIGMSLLGLALAAPVAMGSHSTTDNPPYDSAEGFVLVRGGSLGDAVADISFNAISGPSGEIASGDFTFFTSTGVEIGSVVCLDATGNTATLAGIIELGTREGTVVAFTVVDNTASGGVDTVTALEAVPGPAEDACRTPVTAAPGTVVDDPTRPPRLVVHDASGNPPADFVTGGGVATGGSLGGGADIFLTAQSGAAGENARGSFSFFYGGIGTGVFGHVTCLNVNGNTATVAGIVEGGDRLPTGTIVAFTVVGNTLPETATGPEAVAGSPESACDAPVASAPGTFLTLDPPSLLIFDAPAPPEPPHRPTTGSSQPPPPKVQDSSAPKVKLRYERKQGIDRLVLFVVLDETGTASAAATVDVPKGTSRVYRFKRVTGAAAAGATVKLRLKLSSKGRRAVVRALRKRRKLTVRATVTSRDASGNAKTNKARIRLKR